MQHFEHQLIWKYCVVFGTFFNDIYIQRGDATTPDMQKFKVPIEFGPREKFLAMTNAKPTDEKRHAIQLPRMSFELTQMQFDPTRKIQRQKLISDRGRLILRGAPWNLTFKLSIMTKNMLDATKIAEQVLFMFQPDFTVDVKLINGFDHIDRITTDFAGVQHSDLYEGDFQTLRTTVWEMDFVMKAWLYGPVDDGKQIKKVDITFHPSIERGSAYEELVVVPGLTPEGEPTTDPSQSIPYQEIEEDDNYGIIVQHFPLQPGPEQ